MNETISKEASAPKKKDRLFTFIRITVSLLLLLWIIFRNYKNFQDIYYIIINASLIYLALAVLMHAGHLYMNALRWNVLLRASDERVSLAFLYQSVYIGHFYNNLLPSNIGGDFYKIYDVHKNRDVPLSKAVSTVIMERFFSVIAIITYFAVTSFSLYSILKNSIIMIAVFLALAVLLFIVILRPKLFRIDRFFKRFKRLQKLEKGIENFNSAVNLFRGKWIHLFLGLLFTFLAQGFYIVIYYFLSLSMGLEVSFMTFAFIVPVVFVLTGIPISIGGLGIRENTIVFLLTRFGMANEQAVAFSLLVMFLTLFTAGLGGIIYLFKNIFYKSKGFI
jgi:hypothetical protein